MAVTTSLLTRQLSDGPWLWSSTEITSVGTAPDEYLAWMIVIGGSLGALAAGERAGEADHPPCRLSARCRADRRCAQPRRPAGAQGPAELTQLTRTYNA